MRYSILHPEWITLSVAGKPHHGFDQEWYREEWQRMAGCGPTTGATIAAYIERRDRGAVTDTQEKALAKMDVLWGYATPRMHGLYKTRWLAEGLTHYGEDKGALGTVEMLSVAAIRPLRPSLEKVTRFIAGGLSADAPLGFLDLHNGGDESIYSWHWMPLVALEGEGNAWQATVLDEGKEITFDLSRWLKQSKFGGGFVRVLK